MQKDDTSLAKPADILTAIALLTRLPVKASFDRSPQAVWAYPVAGLAVALCAAGLVWLALLLGVPALLTAGLWLATTIVLTGAMHEDGLADCSDGFWGGWKAERRLEIMKDSQIGTYGVLALVIVVGLRWLAIATLLETAQWFWALLALEALSRSAMPAIMHALPHARDTGLSKSQGRPPLPNAALAIGVSAVIGFITIGLITLKLLVIGAVVACGMAILAQRKIGGQTGDVLGATQQLVMTALLLTVTA